MDTKEKIKELPATPGVYLLKDSKGDVLYIGKANDLRKRVMSYFRSKRYLPARIHSLIDRVRDVDYMPTSTNAEALIYENCLIKQYRPKYNVAMRDDKSYPLLKLTTNEEFPRLMITRKRKDDGALYYGPYTNAKLLREALSILRRLFPLRSCAKMGKSICLNYHLSQCLGPCVGKVGKLAYDEVVSELNLFLEGKRGELSKLLSEKMKRLSRTQAFEEAAKLRDRIEALTAVKEGRVLFSPKGALEELKNVLALSGKLEAIEAFDVSNMMGEEACGSMIYFYQGKPRKSEYKRFKIKGISGKMDDYRMIREIVSRRYKRILEEKKRLPDLVLIDGGKGHLSTAAEELEDLGLQEIPVVGIAKEFERIYVKDRKEPIILPRDSKALQLLQNIRDEAHRFALSYHKKLMRKRTAYSELDDIAGIGPKRKRGLIRFFGSVDNIKRADKETLANVEGMNEKAAEAIMQYFKK